MGNVHSDILSPSSSYRWINCSKSFIYEKNAASRIYNSLCKNDMNEGSVAHTIAEHILYEKMKENKLIDYYNKYDTPFQRALEQLYHVEKDEMKRHGEKYAEYIIEKYESIQKEDKKCVINIEKIVDCSDFAYNCIGTPDVVLYGLNELTVIDYKYGKVYVPAKENTQLKIYALAALSTEREYMPDINTVKIIIFQPRRKKNIDEWKIEKNNLVKWGKETLHPASERIHEQKLVANPGKWCEYCKGKNECKEYIQKSNGYKEEYDKLVQPEDIKHYKCIADKVKALIKTLNETPLTKQLIADAPKIDFLEHLKSLTKSVDIYNRPRHIELDTGVKDSGSAIEDAPTIHKQINTNNHYKTRPLYLRQNKLEMEIKSISEVKHILFSLYEDNSNDPIVITDNEGNNWFLVGPHQQGDALDKYCGDLLKNYVEIKHEINGRKYIFMKKAIVENYQECVTKAKEMSDDVEKIYEWCYSIISLAEASVSNYKEYNQNIDANIKKKLFKNAIMRLFKFRK